jgi:hypothetical protein
VVGGDGAGNEVAEGVAQYGSGSVTELVDDVRDVVAEIIEDDTGHRSGGFSDPARTRAAVNGSKSSPPSRP